MKSFKVFIKTKEYFHIENDAKIWYNISAWEVRDNFINAKRTLKIIGFQDVLGVERLDYDLSNL